MVHAIPLLELEGDRCCPQCPLSTHTLQRAHLHSPSHDECIYSCVPKGRVGVACELQTQANVSSILKGMCACATPANAFWSDQACLIPMQWFHAGLHDMLWAGPFENTPDHHPERRLHQLI